jgi:hypothetical protein
MVYFADVEEAKCVLRFKQTHSVTLVQWWLHTNCSKEALVRKCINNWQKSFAETSCICAKKKNLGRQPSDETVECVHALFLYSPQDIHKAG